MPNLKTRISWLLSAIIIVGLIVLVSNGFYSDFWIPVAAEEVTDAADVGETSVLSLDELEEMAEVEIGTPDALELTTYVPKQSDSLQYGSSAEVFRFILDSKGPYTIRYIGFNVDFTGLRTDKLGSENWKLYVVDGGEVDYENPVGHGERFVDGELKVRLEGERGKAFVAEKGDTEFVLETYVLTDKESGEEPMMGIALAERDWSFVPGYFADAWLTLEEKFGEEFVYGLPTQAIIKN